MWGSIHAITHTWKLVDNSVHFFYCVDCRNQTQHVRLRGQLALGHLAACMFLSFTVSDILFALGSRWNVWHMFALKCGSDMVGLWSLWTLSPVGQIELNRQFWFTQFWMLSDRQAKCFDLSVLWEIEKSFPLGVGMGHRPFSKLYFSRLVWKGGRNRKLPSQLFSFSLMQRLFNAALVHSCSVCFPKGMDTLLTVLIHHQSSFLFSTESPGSATDLERAVLRFSSLELN